MAHEVFITRMAQLSSLGDSLEAFWERLKAGENGAQLVATEIPDVPVALAHFVRSDHLDLPARDKHQHRTETEIATGYLLRELLRDLKNLPIEGAFFGHGQIGQKVGDIFSQTPDGVLTAAVHRHQISEHLNCDPSRIINHSVACITGLSTLGEAFRRIRSGEWQRAVVVVQELRVRDWVLFPYYKMGLLTKSADLSHNMRPFARDRDGFVKGEGGAAFLLENAEAMKESGTQAYCRIEGAHANADGSKLLEPNPDLERARVCIASAIKDANLSVEQIQAVNAHGSASHKSDLMETLLLKSVFGEHAHRLQITASKPQFGHLNTGAAALEIAGLALSIFHQTLTPTLNLTEADPVCDLDYVPLTAREAKVEHALKLSFGFGWSNAALVLGRA